MTISYVGHALGGPTTGTSAPTSLPSSAAAGDLLLLSVRATGSALRASVTPTGWTRVASGYNSGANDSFAWFQRIHDGSPAPTVSWDGSSATWMWALAAWRGVAQGRPIGNRSQSVQLTAVSAPSLPPVVTTDADAVVAWIVGQSTGVVTTPPAGFAQRVADAATGFLIADTVVAAPTTTSAMVGGFSAPTTYEGVALVLVPSTQRLTIDATEEDPANQPLELIGGAFDVVSLRTPTPALDPRWTQATDADGDRLAGLRYKNREITLTLEVVPSDATAAADAQQALAALADKLAKINGEGGTLRRLLPSGDSLTFDLLTADAIDPPWDAGWQLGRSVRFDVQLTAKPFARGAEQGGGSGAETSRPVMRFTEPAIAGDVPALGRLVVTDSEGNVDRAWVQWGLQVETYDPAPTADLFYEAEACTPLNLASIWGLVGASGSFQTVLSGTLAPGWAAILSTKSSGGAHLTHVGEYRVFARLYRPATNTGQVGVALEWALGDFRTFTRNTPVYYAPGQLQGSFTIADLGLVSIPTGTARWEGRVIANSSVKGDTMAIDCLWLVPTERSGEASANEWAANPFASASPTAYLVRDEFNQTAGAATGKTLPIGGTYLGAGDADDFTITGGGVVRTATGDASGGPNTGRLLVASAPSFTTCVARVGMNTSALVGATQGLLLRYADASNHVAVGLTRSGGAPSLSIQKCVGGVYTTLAQATYPLADALGVAYVLNVLIDAAGQLSAWVCPSGQLPGAPLAQAVDSALATGGTLASGKVGLFDRNGTASAATRNFDNFWAWAPDTDAAIFAGASLQVGPDDVTRQDAGKTLWTPVGRYAGDLLTIPPSGEAARTARFVVAASRAIPGEGFDRTIDDLGAQLYVTPRYLVVP